MSKPHAECASIADPSSRRTAHAGRSRQTGEEETLDMSNTVVSRADRRAQHDQLRSSDAVDTVPLTEAPLSALERVVGRVKTTKQLPIRRAVTTVARLPCQG